jgi:hypothetical protein
VYYSISLITLRRWLPPAAFIMIRLNRSWFIKRTSTRATNLRIWATRTLLKHFKLSLCLSNSSTNSFKLRRPSAVNQDAVKLSAELMRCFVLGVYPPVPFARSITHLWLV